MIYRYDPRTKRMVDEPTPRSHTDAEKRLSEHPNSAAFIQEYRRWSPTNSPAEALLRTGETFKQRDPGQPPSAVN